MRSTLTNILFAVAFVSPGILTGAEIQTVAGTGKKEYSGDGGKATEAGLDNPFGIIVGLDGDIYFCDTGNHAVRRISRKKGTIETIAGTGESGYSGDGGDPKEAKLFEPYEVRFHPGGDLFWVEMRNNVVRKIDARSGKISTVAGTGKAGFSGDGGPATEATLKQPHSIQFDASGERLFICDIGNHRIRVVHLADGKIETWCGNGEKGKTEDGAKVSPDTPLNGPRALDRAPDGDLWLALREGNQVYRIDMKSEKLFHVAGTGKKGFQAEAVTVKEAVLSGPKGVAISPDGTQVYLADTESHTMRVIDLREDRPQVKLVAGTGKKGDGPDSPDPLSCAMARPHGVGTDPVSGDLYIGDSESHKVRVVTGLSGGKDRKPLGAYRTETFSVAGKDAKITFPEKAAPGNPWMWRCRFYGAFPSVDEQLLAEGWHIAWIDVAHLFGGPEAMDIFDAFYAEVVSNHGLSSRPVMEGFSRGGLPAIGWAIRRPKDVAGIYLDAPVLDVRSWPKGQSDELWAKCREAWGIENESGEGWQGPLTKLDVLKKAAVPIFVVAGGGDTVVPYAVNAGVLENFFAGSGGQLSVIVKATVEHHPHSLQDPTPVVEWAKSLH